MTKLSKDMVALYDRIPWFFNGTTPDIDVNEWILEQNHKTRTAFLKYSPVCPYTLDVADLLKEKHLYTVPLLVGNASALTGLFTWNESILTLSLTEYQDEWICIASLHANSSRKLFDFIREFGAYEIDMDETKKAGFGH